MKKSAFSAVVMAVVLFLYGYLITEYGHDEEHLQEEIVSEEHSHNHTH